MTRSYTNTDLSQYRFTPSRYRDLVLPEIYIPHRRGSFLEQGAIFASLAAFLLSIAYVTAPKQLFAALDAITGAYSGWRSSRHERFVGEIMQKHGRAGVDSRYIAHLIVEESFKANYDPLFVAAVIKSESSFNPNAVSNRGAIGLMQIMPDTGRYLTGDPKSSWKNDKLRDPAYNLRLGISYLKRLEGLFGQKKRVLIAYNWGPGNLERALKKSDGKIPDQTLKYASKIESDHLSWKSSFGKKLYLDILGQG